MAVAPEPQAIDFVQFVSANTYLVDATELPMFMPAPVIATTIDTVVKSQGSWALYTNQTPNPGIGVYGAYEFGTDVVTKVNLLQPIVDNQFDIFQDEGEEEQVRLLVQTQFVPDQLAYNLRDTVGQTFLNAVLGGNTDPDNVDLTGLTPISYHQGNLPNSHAHALSQIVNISRSQTSLLNGQAGNLDDALSITTYQLPSRMHLTYNTNRLNRQFYLVPQERAASGDYIISALNFGFLPAYTLANLGVTTEPPVNEDLPASAANQLLGGAFAYPRIAMSRVSGPGETDQIELADLWQKNATSFDGFVNSAPPLTPDMTSLQWRNLADPSLQTDANAKVGSNRLHQRIKRHLSKGIPLALHVNVYDNWRTQMIADPTNPVVPLPEANASPIGSHFFTIAGFTRDGNYILINSMGPKVGDQGNFIMCKDYVATEQDCGAGTGVYAMTSPCWSTGQFVDAALPTTKGCQTNQSQFFGFRSVFG